MEDLKRKTWQRPPDFNLCKHSSSKNHREKIYTKEALQLNANLLEINPEIYTAWNYRKLAVKQILESKSDSTVIKHIIDEEL